MNLQSKLDLFLKSPGTIVDVRSPKEFSIGKIPGAINLPLFSDQERHEVGLCHKLEGQKAAVALGLEFVAPKAEMLIHEAIRLPSPIKLYCWRGGLRSRSVGALLEKAAINTLVLDGGYRTWRRKALDLFSTPWNLVRISGLTGTGKTAHLHSLRSKGFQVLDLEGLACHRGSAFGAIGKQPSTEEFHNQIAEVLYGMNPTLPLYVEDESQAIGSCHIPTSFFIQMRNAKREWIEKSLDDRLHHIQETYGSIPKEDLIASLLKIQKRLGKEKTDQAVVWVNEGKLKEAATLILDYYDRVYKR